MGIVIRESSKSTVITYIGVIIGYLNWGLLLPNCLLVEQLGLLKLLRDSSHLLASLSSIGSFPTITKFFPILKKERKENNILHFTIIWSLFGFIFFSAIYFFLKDTLIYTFQGNSPLFTKYILFVIPFGFSLLYYDLIATYLQSLYKIFIPAVIKEVINRLLIFSLLIVYIYLGVSFRTFTILFIIIHFISLLIVIGYLIYLRGWKTMPVLNFFNHPAKSQVINFSLISLLTGASMITVKYVDSFMISSFVGLDSTGIYGVALLICTVIEIPKRFISRSVYPIIAEAWVKEKPQQVNQLYKKTSLNQLIIGSLLFLIIWLNIEDFFYFLPPVYSQGKWVVFCLGISKVIDLAFGNNIEIVTTSKHYKYQVGITVTLLIITVITNLIFIPIYGIVGAGIATALSITLYNLIIFLLIKTKLNFQPFYSGHLIIVAIFIAVFFAFSFIKPDLHPVLSVIIKSSLIVTVFGFLILISKVSKEVNDSFSHVVDKFLKR